MKIFRIFFIVAFAVIVCTALIDLFGCLETEIKKPQKQDRVDLAVAHEIEITKDLKLGYVPKERLLLANAVTKELKESPKRRTKDNIEWEERGPNNVGGRTRAIIFDQADTTNSTVIAGSVSGGIWRGRQIFTLKPIWTNLTPFASNLAVGSLVQDPTDPNIIYAGTGEGWFNGDAVRGIGILKTSDGGQTWERLPSTAVSAFRYVQKLLFDGDGALLACTRSSGIMRSTDGGTSWDKIFGSGIGGFSDRAADLEIAPDGTYYATLGIFSSDGLYRSKDKGGTWTFLHKNGMPDQGFRRVEVATAPSDSNVVYAILEATDGSCLGIYRSRDQGENWTSLEIPESASGLIFGRNQVWYDVIIAVHPTDADHVFIGAVNLFRSGNGGDQWDQLSNWFDTYEHPYVHADQHNILFDASNPTRGIFANDGGVFISTNLHIGDPQFMHVVTDYNVTQFYSCAVHPFLPGVMAGGSQDNGTQAIIDEYSQTGNKISGGDGGFTHFAGENGEYLVTSFTNNNYNIYRDYNFIENVSFDGGRFINPTTMIDHTLYGNAGEGQYFRLDITGDLTEELVYVYEFDDRAISHISSSPNVDNRMYFGFSNGRVIYVDNVHEDFLKNGTVIFDISGNVSCVAIEPGNENHIIITISNYGENSVYETWNGGLNWQNAENNIPDIPVRWVIFAPGKPQEVLLATETGIWRTDSIQGAWTTWEPDPTFPNVRTDMLAIQESTGQIIAGTHGRGFFITDHYEEFVAIDEVNRHRSELKIYPNPVSDMLHIIDDKKPSPYFIYTNSGELIQKGQLIDKRIDVRLLKSGLYIINIIEENSIESATFIKI